MSFFKTLSFNSDVSSYSEAIKQWSDLTVQYLHYDLKARSSKPVRIDPYVVVMNTFKQTRWNRLNTSQETRQEWLKENKAVLKHLLKYTEKVYNVIVSLTQCKLDVDDKRK